MATFNDRVSIDQFIKNDGWLDSCMDDRDAPDNPPAVRIVEYRNMGGDRAYGVVFENEPDYFKYDAESAYIREPKVIWKRNATV